MRSEVDQELICNDFCRTGHLRGRTRRGEDPDVHKYDQWAEYCQENLRTYIEHGKIGQDRAEFFVKAVLGELDLAHVKLSNATYLKVSVDNLFAAGVSARVR